MRMAWHALALAAVACGSAWSLSLAQDAPDDAPAGKKDQKAAAVPKLPPPPPIRNVKLGPTLPTISIRRSANPGFNVTMVDTALLPRDRAGIWVLDFAFKPVRIWTVEIPGKGRRQVHYLYYRVINRTGKPRMFVPQFTLVTDTNKRYDDMVIPKAVEVIQAREDPSIRLLGAVDIIGVLPPSTKQGVDDAVYGVAVWEGVDPHADAFKVYVRGLSDGYRERKPPGTNETVAQYKTLRIDFIRRGDERNLKENEIELGDPPYDWIYW
jgi:hypothetical protein